MLKIYWLKLRVINMEDKIVIPVSLLNTIDDEFPVDEDFATVLRLLLKRISCENSSGDIRHESCEIRTAAKMLYQSIIFLNKK